MHKNKKTKYFRVIGYYIEHLIRLVKIFQIASQRFRLKSDVYNDIIFTVCGLVRLRIGSLILAVT
jgi:hypothetical protein